MATHLIPIRFTNIKEREEKFSTNGRDFNVYEILSDIKIYIELQ